MTVEEKAKLIDHFLKGLKDASFASSIADIIELRRLPSPENKDKFKIIEYEIERLELVEFIRGGDNSTLGGQKYYFISGKGLDLLSRDESSIVLLQDKSLSTYRDSIRQNRNWDRTVFLAHAKEDKDFIRNLYTSLLQNELEPWFDEEQLMPGEKWDDKIREAIQKSRFFLACISEHSITKNGYVQRELRLALNELEEKNPNTIYFIPCLIGTNEIPSLKVGTITLSDYQAISIDNEKGLSKLIEQLRTQLKLGTNIIKEKDLHSQNYGNPNLVLSAKIVDSQNEWDKTLMKDLNPIPVFIRGLSKVQLAKKIVFEIKNVGDIYDSSVLLEFRIKTFKNEIEFGIDEADVKKSTPISYKTLDRTIEVKYIESKRTMTIDVMYVSNFPRIEIEVKQLKSSKANYITESLIVLEYKNSDYIELGDAQDYRAMIGV